MNSSPGPVDVPPARLAPKAWVLRPKLETDPQEGSTAPSSLQSAIDVHGSKPPTSGLTEQLDRNQSVAVDPEIQPSNPPSEESTPTLWVTTADPSQASKECPFLNSSGMLFVPVPRYKALFSICTVRLCDYTLYCQAKKAPIPDCDFPQAADHPVVNVTWNDAKKFCEWLTKKEHDEKILPTNMLYRLPTDGEWSAAVGLPNEIQSCPKARSGKIRSYPWGVSFPPPAGVGNYSSVLKVDEFAETSPVASFPANEFGICDLGGNVWEWCSDSYSPAENLRVARGASCFNDSEEYLLSSHREAIADNKCRNNLGFRLVLSGELFKDPIHRAQIDPWA